MIAKAITDSILFKLLMVFIFSGIVAGCTMSMGGFVPLVFLVVCIFTGSFLALAFYVEYQRYKHG